MTSGSSTVRTATAIRASAFRTRCAARASAWKGTVPGGFGYKFELDFAPGETDFTDAYLDYKKGPWTFTVGQHNNFQSLDELTSSLHSNFIERSAFTDAFGFERRVGASVQYAKDALLVQTGIFTDSINDLNNIGDDNNSWSSDSRIVYAPEIGRQPAALWGKLPLSRSQWLSERPPLSPAPGDPHY